MLCKCGCLQEVKKGNSYINGHNQIGKKDSIETRTKKSLAMKGRSKSEEHRKNLSIGMKGRIPWNKGTKGLQISWCKGLTKETDERVMKFSKPKPEGFGIGKSNNNYNHGNCYDWRINSQICLERDNYICQNPACKCKSKSINIHHIDENRDNNILENLITLCVSCHRRIHFLLEYINEGSN